MLAYKNFKAKIKVKDLFNL